MQITMDVKNTTVDGDIYLKDGHGILTRLENIALLINEVSAVIIETVVQDGYIANGTVDIYDVVTNKLLSTGITDSNGSINISSGLATLQKYVRVVVYDGIDISTNEPFTGYLSSIIDITSGATSAVINPITTIVEKTIDVFTSDEIAAKKEIIANGLGLNVGQLDVDYLAVGNTDIGKAATKIQCFQKLLVKASSVLSVSDIAEDIAIAIIESVDDASGFTDLSGNVLGLVDFASDDVLTRMTKHMTLNAVQMTNLKATLTSAVTAVDNVVDGNLIELVKVNKAANNVVGYTSTVDIVVNVAEIANEELGTIQI